MIVGKLVSALAVALLLAAPARAQDALVTYKSLSPELALDLARAALAECRKRGYQAAVAVVDRFGVTQVMLRDRFAGPHTPCEPPSARPGPPSASAPTPPISSHRRSPACRRRGCGNLPRAVILGGGVMIEAGGSLVGAVGVSGGPGGDADDACAKAGIEAVRDKLDF